MTKVEDRYFVSDIEIPSVLRGHSELYEGLYKKLKNAFIDLKNVKIGDEILEINGLKVAQVVENYINNNLGGDFSSTGYTLAARHIFTNLAELGVKVPKGDLKLKLKNNDLSSSYEINAKWIYFPEKVSQAPLVKAPKYNLAADFIDEVVVENSLENLLHKNFKIEVAQKVKPLKHNHNRAGADILTQKDFRHKSFLPPLGEIYWETSLNEEIYAYIFKANTQIVGYLCLPTFSKRGYSAENYLISLEKVLEKFNKYAESVVIDITDNTGGNMLFMYQLMSYLSSKPLEIPKHIEYVDQEMCFKMANLKLKLKSLVSNNAVKHEKIYGQEVTLNFIKNLNLYADTIIGLWNEGQIVTPPLHLFGIDLIEPSKYANIGDKPLYILTNNYCFSCADYFAAILKDNQRAVLIGEKTAGAGGYVNSYSYPNSLGVKSCSLTGSLGVRSNGEIIENRGIDPDVLYKISVSDLQTGYQNYIKFICETLSS